MSLKVLKLDQGATEMFVSEFEKEESLWNVMSEIYKNCDAKKTKSQKIAWMRDSISLILKENNSISAF